MLPVRRRHARRRSIRGARPEDFVRPKTEEIGEMARPRAKELTERELEVLKLAAQGKSNREIADELVISIRTVQTHLSNIFNKMGVGSRTEAVVHALRQGCLTLEDTREDTP